MTITVMLFEHGMAHPAGQPRHDGECPGTPVDVVENSRGGGGVYYQQRERALFSLRFPRRGDYSSLIGGVRVHAQFGLPTYAVYADGDPLNTLVIATLIRFPWYWAVTVAGVPDWIDPNDNGSLTIGGSGKIHREEGVLCGQIKPDGSFTLYFDQYDHERSGD